MLMERMQRLRWSVRTTMLAAGATNCGLEPALRKLKAIDFDLGGDFRSHAGPDHRTRGTRRPQTPPGDIFLTQ